MVVADASAIVLALLGGGEARVRLGSAPLHVPHLADAEIAQALRSQVLRGVASSERCERALGRWQRLGVRRHPGWLLLARVWDLRDNLSAYDATYVALAERLGCPLLTADRRIARAPGVECEVLSLA